MRDILQKLLKEYYNTDLIAKKVVIIGEGAKQQVHIFDALMADEWKLRLNNGDPDIEKTEKILENRRKMKAQQLFRRTLAILKYKEETDNWNREYHKTPPKEESIQNTPHEELIQYVEGALYFMDVITPFEYTEMSAIVDERGIMQGMQLHPKESDDPTDGALNPA